MARSRRGGGGSLLGVVVVPLPVRGLAPAAPPPPRFPPRHHRHPRHAQHTDDQGAIDPAGIFGPYLRAWPANQLNHLSSVRIGGAAAGANTDGWRFDPPTRKFESDCNASKFGVSGGATGLGGGVIAEPGGGSISVGPGGP